MSEQRTKNSGSDSSVDETSEQTGNTVDMVSWLADRAAERVANGTLREALDWYHKLLQVGRHDVELVKRTHVRMAELLMQMGDVHRAETHLLEAVAMDPAESYGHYLLGRVYSEMREWDSAVQHSRLACQLEPGTSEFHQILGRALLCEGDWTNGCKALERAIELDPDNGVAVCDLAMAEAQQGRCDRAEQLLREAIVHNRKEVLLSETLAMVMRMRKVQTERRVQPSTGLQSNTSAKTSPFSRHVCEMLDSSLGGKGYPQGAIDGAIRLCLDFEVLCGTIHGNPSVMAAACEYTISRLMGLKGVTQMRLAEQYSVSAAGISAKYRAMVWKLRLVDGDSRYVPEEAFRNLDLPTDT